MSQVHSVATKPEILLRRALWRKGFRYRTNDKRLPGKPDIVLPKYKTVVFMHGCFWHGHEFCSHSSIPKTNYQYWTDKISNNKQRDQDNWRQLEAKGWFVIIVWECELGKARIEDTVNRVAEEILRNGKRLSMIQEERRKLREDYLRERHSHKERETQLIKELKNKYH